MAKRTKSSFGGEVVAGLEELRDDVPVTVRDVVTDKRWGVVRGVGAHRCISPMTYGSRAEALLAAKLRHAQGVPAVVCRLTVTAHLPARRVRLNPKAKP